MPAIFRHSERRGYRHFLYGSSETTLASLRQNLKRDFPQARIVGHRSPPFRVPTADEERHDDQLVNAAEPDIVWVGLGAQTQEDRKRDVEGKSVSVRVDLGGCCINKKKKKQKHKKT